MDFFSWVCKHSLPHRCGILLPIPYTSFASPLIFGLVFLEITLPSEYWLEFSNRKNTLNCRVFFSAKFAARYITRRKLLVEKCVKEAQAGKLRAFEKTFQFPISFFGWMRYFCSAGRLHSAISLGIFWSAWISQNRHCNGLERRKRYPPATSEVVMTAIIRLESIELIYGIFILFHAF